MTKEFEKKLDELEEAAKLDGTECGEWWSALVNLQHRIWEGASEEFYQAWQKEVESEHKRLKTEFQIVEEEYTRTVKERRLDYIG